MPVLDQATANSYTGNGVATVYAYTFKLLDEGDLLVEVDNVVQTLSTHYTVSGVGNSGGGNVTFVTAPPNGDAVELSRDMEFARATDYQENGDLQASTLDEDIDRVVMLTQQVRDQQTAGGYNFIQSGSGAVTRTVQAKLRDVVNVKDFGAVGDGSTDDLAALQAALAASNHVIVPAGSYRLPFTSTSALTPAAGAVLEGAGDDCTTITFVPSSTSDRNAFALSAGLFTLRGIKVVLSVPAGGTCSMFSLAASGLLVEDCDLDGTITNSGASLTHTAHMVKFPASGTVTDIDFINCDVHRFNYGTLKTNTSTSVNRRISFAQCDFFGNYNEDLGFNSPAVGAVMDDIQVYMCRFRDGAGSSASISQLHCAFASASNFRVSGCSFSGTVSEAIHIEENSLYGAITGNTIEVDTNGSSAIQITDNDVSGTAYMPQFITITGNTVKKSGTQKEANTYGIYLVTDASGEVPAKNLVISGNVCSGWSDGIVSGATLDDGCRISDNVADNCTNGFHIADSSLCLYDNTSRGCTVGLYSSAAAVATRHSFINCTTNVDAVYYQVTLLDPTFIFPEFAHAGGSTTVYKNLLALSADDRVHGFTEISSRAAAAVADDAFRRDEVTWDGTTFTATNKLELEPGVVTLDSARNSSLLAVAVFATAGRTLDLSVRLAGMAVVAA